MPAQWLSGKLLSEKIQNNLREQILSLRSKGFRAPTLAVILVGNDPASGIYVNHKIKACEKTGLISKFFRLEEKCTEDELLQLIDQLNQQSDVDGILVQVPLPSHISKQKVIERIHPQKDADGFHPYNLGKLAQNNPTLRPCTPYGIIRLCEYYQISFKGMNAVILGASTIVGRPLLLELLNAGATVTICNTKTKNLQEHIERAEILISATGKRDLVKAEWIKPGAVVIDVGIHRLEDNKICGDLPTDQIAEKASFLTPVPGGVGPMTIAILLENTFMAYQEKCQ